MNILNDRENLEMKHTIIQISDIISYHLLLQFEEMAVANAFTHETMVIDQVTHRQNQK